MPNPVAYNSSTTPTGTFKRSSITYGLSGSNYGANSPGGLTYYNSLPTSSAWVIVSDSYTLGLSTQGNAKPVMWSTGSASTGSLIRLINGLPSMTSSFTDYYSAVNWLQSTNKYFLSNNGYENIVTDGLVLNLDVGWWNSYPGTGNTIYDLSGNANHGTLYNGVGYSTNSGGVLTFDGIDDWVNTNGPNLTSSNYTVIGAARYTGTSPHARMINAQYTGVNGSNWLIGHWNGTTLNYYAEGWVTPAGNGPDDTNWRIYSATGDIAGDSYSMYVNNALYVGPNSNGSFGPLRFAIGGYNAGSEASQGEFSFLLAYNRVLSANEILQNYNVYKSRFGL
jgi:hypothetical protein